MADTCSVPPKTKRASRRTIEELEARLNALRPANQASAQATSSGQKTVLFAEEQLADNARAGSPGSGNPVALSRIFRSTMIVPPPCIEMQ